MAEPIYDIRKISTVKGTPLTYVLVWFWRTQAAKDAQAPPYLVEEFLMDLATKGNRVARDANGNSKLQDGSVISDDDILVAQEAANAAIRQVKNDPNSTPADVAAAITKFKPRYDFVREDFDIDPAPEMLANISNLWKAAELNKQRGDLTFHAADPAFTDDSEDPRGVLAHPEVAKIRPNRLR